jgi:choline dehydrogenase-like flavoprotein
VARRRVRAAGGRVFGERTIGVTSPSRWSEDELRTLAAVAETFVRGGAVRRANLAASAIERSLDPGQVRQLRLVLRLLESPLANLVLARRPSRFRDLAPPRRERYLLSWANSPIPQRRSAFHALRRLLTFIAYADPGETAPNPHWRTSGYAVERPPVTPDRTPLRPFPLPAVVGGGIAIEADVVVVGSGAGGGVVAADLAAAGRSVVVLEAGPFVDEATMPATELDSFDRLYLDQGLASTWDGAALLLAGSAVGGGTLINWMTCAMPPDDVRSDWRRDHGIDTGDAFAADAIALAGELSVAPSPAMPPKDAAILQGAEALSWRASTIERNARGCTDCGSCSFGCPRGTKASGIRAHLATAQAHGARIVPRARCDRILLEGGRATGVEATVQTADGPVKLSVRAPQVVVAAGALRTPGVLARSGIAHPAIGRYLRIHPAPVVAGRMPEPVKMWKGPLQAARLDEFAASGPGRHGYVVESAPAHLGLLALALPWEGTDAHEAVMQRAASIAPLVAVTRDGGEGRVVETKRGGTRIDYRLDATGIATLRHALVSMARLSRAAGALEIIAVGMPPAVFGRHGIPSGGEASTFAAFEDHLSRFDFAPNRGSVFSAHQMGTARMGSDRRLHPCDLRGHLRRGAGRRDAVVGGLYVADASLFPTAIGANPMLTIMALARHVARTVAAEG